MVVANGIVEVNGIPHVEGVADELKKRGIEIDDFETEHVLFVIRRDTLDTVRREVDEIKGVAHVRRVHIAYYSIEDPEIV